MNITKIFLLLFFIGSAPAWACDFCMLGQGLSPSLLPSGQGVTIDNSWTASDRVYDHNSVQDSKGKKEGWLIETLTAFYGISDRWTVSLGLPYVMKSNVDFEEVSGFNTGAMVQGLGDISFTGRYTVLREHSLDRTTVAGFLVGLKTATGATGIRDNHGDVLDRHVQPGTGSYDVRAGFTGSYATAAGYQITGDLLYNFAGPGHWGGYSHRYGNSMNVDTKFYRRVSSADRGIFLFTGPAWDWTGREQGVFTASGYAADLQNNSSGGSVVFWQFGVYAVMSPQATANFSFAPAIFHDMNYDPAFEADPAESYKLDLSLTFLL